ncbi:MAG: hypothetical protein EB015_15130 [Methylocystaceae bacterium]|nr:hypothetical protein [Methylocystaceae bacterium]
MQNSHDLKDIKSPSIVSRKHVGVRELLSELFSLSRQNQRLGPIEIAVPFLEAAPLGARSKSAVACTSFLILSGFDDEAIVDALAYAYRMHMEAKGQPYKPLSQIVADARRRMSEKNGMVIRPVSELDDALTTSSWSVFR